jgi:hypothetical protein
MRNLPKVVERGTNESERLPIHLKFISDNLKSSLCTDKTQKEEHPTLPPLFEKAIEISERGSRPVTGGSPAVTGTKWDGMFKAIFLDGCLLF